MTPEVRTAAAFFLFIAAGYLAYLGLAAAGAYEDGEARWALRASGVVALGAVGMLCWAAQW